MKRKKTDICEVCIGCGEWNDGDGTRACLRCIKIEQKLPGSNAGRVGPHSPARRENAEPPYHKAPWNYAHDLETSVRFVDLALYQKVIVLGILNGRKLQEIGREFGWSPSKTRREYKKIMQTLKQGGS